MGLSGVPFTGPDLGGYIGDGNKDLFRRWVEVGVFAPYLRNHRGPYTAANEPWAYGEEVEAISKAYIGFRYELMPYLYSTFYEAVETGMPVSRSLSIDHSFDANVFKPEFQYEFLFGPGLLVNPMTSQEQAKSTYLPAGQWYDLFTDERLDGGRVHHSGLCGPQDSDLREGFRDHSHAGKSAIDAGRSGAGAHRARFQRHRAERIRLLRR